MRKLLLLAAAFGFLSAGLAAVAVGVAWPRLIDLLNVEASVAVTPCQTHSDCPPSNNLCTYAYCTGPPQGYCIYPQYIPPVCDDGVSCTSDFCDPAAAGGVGACVNTPDDLACEDGFFCIDDVCDPVNGCMHFTDSICDDSNYCTVDFCNENTDSCEITPAANGIPCDDGDPSTTGDVCSGGVCAGTVPTPTGTATPTVTATPTPSPTPQADADGDTVPDDAEKAFGSDPNDPNSTPESLSFEPDTCTDGVDNDGDGLTDSEDQGCVTPPTRTVTIPAASWANFAWTGNSSPQTVADCFGAGNVAVMYRLDAATGTFQRWIRDRDDLSNMGDVRRFDTLLALNTSAQPATCIMPDDVVPHSFTIRAGRWANFAWLANSFPAEVAPQACSEGSIAVIYRLDALSQTFQRWIRGRPELSNMTDVQPYDALLALNGSGQPSTCTFSHYGQLAASSS